MDRRISIRPADWAHMGDQLIALRRRVFCEEQGVAESIEIDGRDPRCVHAAAVDDATGHVVGTARMDIIKPTAPHDATDPPPSPSRSAPDSAGPDDARTATALDRTDEPGPQPHPGRAGSGDLGHIGRVAVLPSYRNLGIGKRLVQFMIDHARRRGLTRVDLNAQTAAIDFYKALGFTPHGPEFIEADIPHINMIRDLD